MTYIEIAAFAIIGIAALIAVFGLALGLCRAAKDEVTDNRQWMEDHLADTTATTGRRH